MECDVAIVGAGAAGLAALAELKHAGHDAVCLEAGNRVGGRILTVHDRLSPLPIELGAEFVHGRPREIWDLIEAHTLSAYEHTSQALYLDRGRVLEKKDTGEFAGQVVSRMARSSRRKDASFEDYLRRSRQPAEKKNWARVYIEGFNAASSARVSTDFLEKDAEAADRIEGDRAFRILGGYDSLIASVLRSIPDHDSAVRLNSVVRKITWRKGSVRLEFESLLDGERSSLHARRAIVTVPLGVLRAAPPAPGAILFDPEPRPVLQAAQSLAFGQVYRITFRFRHAFWEDDPKLKQTGFLISQDRRFFTWWTPHPVIAPLLTGWMAGSAADSFRVTNTARISAEALASLGRILHRKIPRPEAFYFHNWRNDPFFRGAYSYVPVDASSARQTLARPIAGTLLFAGEATDLKGHGGTVHGAIATGRRAAEWILRAHER